MGAHRALWGASGAPPPALTQLLSGLPIEGPSLTLVPGESAHGSQNSQGPEGQGIGVTGGHSGHGLGVLGRQSGASRSTVATPAAQAEMGAGRQGGPLPSGRGVPASPLSRETTLPEGGDGLQNGLLPGARTSLASSLSSVPTAAAGSLSGPSAHLLLARC